MLVDTEYLRSSKKLVVSYVDKSGDIKLKYYDWDNPMKYVACHDTDPQRDEKYKSWDGKSIKQIDVDRPDRYAIYEFLDALPESERDEIFEFNLPKIYFIDIETEIVDGFPEAADIKDNDGNVTKEGASTSVLSISIVYDDKVILLGLKDLSEDAQKRIHNNTNEYFKEHGTVYKFKYIKYDDEFDMLYSFMNKMVPKMPLLTGWNFLDYDWQFLVNRSRKINKWVNGKEYKIDVRNTSITKKMNKVWSTEYEIPAHRMIFDYKQLYEVCDTSIKVKESSSLEFVSKKLVDVAKIKYINSIFKLKEDSVVDGRNFNAGDICRREDDLYYMYIGIERIDFSVKVFDRYKDLFEEKSLSDLQVLYEEDFEIYMYYNAVDSVLVQKIHEKRNYISIIYAISSLSKIKIVDVVSQMNNALGSLAITEGVLRNRFREMDNIILFRDSTNAGDESTIAGGWVKDPIVGMNQWVCVYDFASLYPTTQLEFFISPENFIGVQDPKNLDMCTNGHKIDLDEHVVCVNQVVFAKRMSPTLCMLADVYADRKKNKKIMMARKEELDKVQDEIKKLELELV